MTRDQLLVQLAVARKVFDDKLALVPYHDLKREVPGYGRSVAQLVAHLAAYDQLVADRLESAGHGAMTELPADRDPGQYEQTTWTFADEWPVDQVFHRAEASFRTVVSRLREVADDELNGLVGAGGVLDRTWLAGRMPWRAIFDDTAGHYQRHESMLDAARLVAQR